MERQVILDVKLCNPLVNHRGGYSGFEKAYLVM